MSIQSFTLDGPAGEIRATLYAPPQARHTLVLAHGAGAGQGHPWMRARAGDLADRGVRVVTFDFPYITSGRKAPDRTPVLLATWRAVVAHAAATWPQEPLAIGGKSMGGRMATMLVAEDDVPAAVRGCVAMGYPLHPPGKPDQLRVAHLAAIRVPLLVIQGDRDPFGGPDDIRREFAAAGAHPEVVEVPQGGHGFEVRKRDAPQAEVYTRVAETVVRWLDTLPVADLG
jgi:predicted alpha/beta-hydrolase family hydrolase